MSFSPCSSERPFLSSHFRWEIVSLLAGQAQQPVKGILVSMSELEKVNSLRTGESKGANSKL